MLELITGSLGSFGLFLSLVVTFKTNFLTNDRVRRGRYLQFKQIRKEWKKDKINGYFAFQNYMGSRLKDEEINFILKSPDAFKIMSLIKGASGRYQFDGKSFKTIIKKTKYLGSILGYIVSSIPLLLYLSFSSQLVTLIGLPSYLVILPFVVGVFGVVAWNSLLSINRISKARYLETLSNKNKQIIPNNGAHHVQ